VEIPNTNTYEFGAAWRRVCTQGKPYLSVKLDGPTLAVPIPRVLIEQNDGSYSSGRLRQRSRVQRAPFAQPFGELVTRTSLGSRLRHYIRNIARASGNACNHW
jgi:hypothetical protein